MAGLMKAKPLARQNIIVLLDMISKHKIITTKATNAASNKLKEKAWKSIAQEFGALTGEIRRPEQLRLKWENLKKNARRRSALIRQNNYKKVFSSSDDILEHVTSILSGTCTGSSVEIGGDRVNEDAVSQTSSDVVVEVLHLQPPPEVPKNIDVDSNCSDSGDSTLEADGELRASITPKILKNPNKVSNKNRKLNEEVLKAQRDKDLAIALYFQKKAEKVDLECRKLAYELDRLKTRLKRKRY